ncbi:MAG: alpha/beta hydrolase [Deltaproteobacteria bacterium]|nr:alpha/beta hydrolase [Deltaproteobacteria bacterium]
MRRWRGLKALVHDAIDATTALVAEGHDSAARSVLRVTDHVPAVAAPAREIDDVRRLSTDGVLGTVRALNRAVAVVTDAGLDVTEQIQRRSASRREAPLGARLVPMRSDRTRSWEWVGDAALGAVNGVIGDRLHARGNGLDLGMTLRIGDAYAEPVASSAAVADAKLAVFVHGLATTEWSWCLDAETRLGDPGANFGTMLARDLGYTPVFVRYNTGRPIADNGRALDDALDGFVSRCPSPIEEILLVGHSLGGLVLRSACHSATEKERPWVRRVRHVFCLGSPHRGAPLEKIGFALTRMLASVDLPGTLVPARILERRSAGIRDLRHGLDGGDLDDVPLLAHASYHFVHATVTEDVAHPVGTVVGDLLVRTASASGPRAGSVAAVTTTHLGGVLHHQLQSHPAVYELIRRSCADRSPEPSTPDE